MFDFLLAKKTQTRTPVEEALSYFTQPLPIPTKQI